MNSADLGIICDETRDSWGQRALMELYHSLAAGPPNGHARSAAEPSARPKALATPSGSIRRWGPGPEQPLPGEESVFGQLECLLAVAGSAQYRVGDELHPLRAHTLVWFLPYSMRVQTAASDDFEGWSGRFGPSILARVGLDLTTEVTPALQGSSWSRRLTKAAARRLQTQFEHLCAADIGTEQFSVGLEYLLLTAWAEQRKPTRLDDLTELHPAVAKAAQVLKDYPETGSLRLLAHECGASASWLSRLFREQVGISLVGYRNQSRIERFFELYGDGGDVNLTQAAQSAGFGSYAQFHRVFKEQLGYSPGELKRGIRARPAPNGAPPTGGHGAP